MNLSFVEAFSWVRTRPLPAMSMAFGLRGVHERRRYRPRDLARHDLLTFQRGSHPHMTLLDLLRGAGVQAPRIHAVSSISAMLRLVCSGFGIALLPRAALDPQLADPQLALLSRSASRSARKRWWRGRAARLHHKK